MRRCAVVLVAVLAASAVASRAASSSRGEGVIVFSATTPSVNLGRVQLYAIKVSGGARVFLARHPASLPVFADAVPSPDRKLVAFVGRRGGMVDLFVMRPDGTGIRPLTDTAAVEANPSWSSDGRLIAVTLVEETGASSQIAVVAARGGSERVVAQGGLKPQFSPDGRTLLFVGDLVGNSPTGIYVVPVAGGPARLVARGNSPSWSHDSRRIAFVDSEGRLSVLNPRTGAVRRLVRTGFPIVAPLWSPGDRTLAVATGGLSLVDVASGRVERQLRDAAPLAWSADGSRLAVRRFSKQLAVFTVSSRRVRALTAVEPQGVVVRAWWLGPDTLAFELKQTYSPLGLFTVHPDGSGVKLLTHDLDSFDPAWSPDGSSIAFTKSNGQRSSIWKMDVSGANVRQLTPWTTGVRYSQPAWSPDGLRIAFVRNTGGGQGSALMVTEDDGSLTTKIGFDPVLAPRSAPSWSEDGKRIAWQRAIYLADGSGSQPIDPSAADVWSPTYSPDGTKLAYMRYRDFNGSPPQLIEKDLKTGTLKLLTTKPSPFGGVFSPDSSQVAFVSQPGGSGSFGISVVSVGGGDERALLATGVDIRSEFLTEPSWSPDGLHLVVPASTDKTDLAIVNTDLTLPTEVGFQAQETLQAAWQPAPH